MEYIIYYLTLNFYVIIGIVVLNTQPKPIQDYIDNWLNQAPNNAAILLAYIYWPIVILAAAINSKK